jgi:hypothetical protein
MRGGARRAPHAGGGCDTALRGMARGQHTNVTGIDSESQRNFLAARVFRAAQTSAAESISLGRVSALVSRPWNRIRDHRRQHA